MLLVILWIYFIIVTIFFTIGSGMNIAHGDLIVRNPSADTLFISFLFFRVPIFVMACLYLLSLSS